MAPSGNRFYHDHSPELTSLAGTFIGGKLYISKVRQGMYQFSETGIFPQFFPHYVRPRRSQLPARMSEAEVSAHFIRHGAGCRHRQQRC